MSSNRSRAAAPRATGSCLSPRCGAPSSCTSPRKLYVRMFAVACAMSSVAGAGSRLGFAALDRGAPAPATIAFTAAAAAFAVTASTRPRELYRPALAAALKLAPGRRSARSPCSWTAESECWWFALPLLWVVATLSSTPLARRGGRRDRHGVRRRARSSAGRRSASSATSARCRRRSPSPRTRSSARVLVDGLRRARPRTRARLAPRRGRRRSACRVRVPTAAPAAPRAPGRRDRDDGDRRPASRLTARQLEVALLLRDGPAPDRGRRVPGDLRQAGRAAVCWRPRARRSRDDHAARRDARDGRARYSTAG